MSCVQTIGAHVIVRQSAVRRVLRLLQIWRRRLEDRRTLAIMDNRSLRDFGATRYDASMEIRKPFWRG